MIKKIISAIAFLLGGGAIGTIMIMAALKSYKEDKVQLSDLTHFEGKLENFRIDFEQSTSEPTRKFKFLAIRINSIDQTFGIYRPEQQYNDMLNNIKIGDSVSIYYRQHSNSYDTFISGEPFDSDIYQLSINNITYIKPVQVKSDHSKGNVAALVGGIFIIIVVLIAAIFKMRE